MICSSKVHKSVSCKNETYWVCTSISGLLDVDEDGVLSLLDCDDEDPTALSRLNDNDCDGILASNDCDDNDTTSYTKSMDADCDNV